MSRWRSGITRAAVIAAFSWCAVTSFERGASAVPPPRARPPTRTSVNHNVNVNRNVNVNVHHGHAYHPVGRAVGVAAAATVTAVAIGSVVASLPPSCHAVAMNGLTYQQCGSSWYQPRYAGTTVSYVVVNPPH
jgi:hypothetical protein